MNPVLRYAKCLQGSFIVFSLVLIALRPAGLTANSGLSYYSVIRITILPYLVLLLSGGYFFWRIAVSLPNVEAFKKMRMGLQLCTFSLIGLMLSPDIANTIFAHVHVIFGALLFVTELLLSGWIVMNAYSDMLSKLLAGTELAAGIICFFSIINLLSWQIEGQFIFQIMFGLLLTRTLTQMINLPSQPSIEQA